MTLQSPSVPRARLAGAAGVVLGVLLLHAAVLRGWADRPPPQPRPGAAVKALQVSLTVARLQAAPSQTASAQVPGATGPTSDVAAAPAPARTPQPPPRSTRPPPPAAAAEASATPLAAAVAPSPTAPAPADPEAGLAEAARPTPASALAGITVPTYPTRLPPAFVLSYEVQRPGRPSGPVELAWQPDGDRYTLSLGRRGLGSTSTGNLDALGVAPERQADLRRAREVRAVNFQRDAGRITYSGPQVEHPLLPGAQDRLSWLVQLAGVLSADATLSAPGRTVQLYVTGPRGDAAVWTFIVAGPEAVELPGGARVQALRLLREPEGPHDTRVELWADPARHHLPVRLRLQPRMAADATEFLLAAGGARPTP